MTGFMRAERESGCAESAFIDGKQRPLGLEYHGVPLENTQTESETSRASFTFFNHYDPIPVHNPLGMFVL